MCRSFKSFFEFFHHPTVRAIALIFPIGAGMLSIPYVFIHIGAVVGTTYLVGLGMIMYAVHRMVAELVIATRRHLEITGIVRMYLGPSAALVMAIVFVSLHIGALVAYLIGIGESSAALGGFSAVSWAGIFFICASYVVFRGARRVVQFDLLIEGLFFVLVGIIVVFSFHYTPVIPRMPDGTLSFFVPYGVFLFAYHSVAPIPEAETFTGAHHHLLRRAVLVSSALAIAVYILFAYAVGNMSGGATTEIATIGLMRSAGRVIGYAGTLVAICTMSISFVTIADAMRRTFQWDFGFSVRAAGVCAVGIPALIYMLGAHGFVAVISVVGSTCGTIEIVLIIAAFWRMHRLRTHRTRLS